MSTPKSSVAAVRAANRIRAVQQFGTRHSPSIAGIIDEEFKEMVEAADGFHNQLVHTGKATLKQNDRLAMALADVKGGGL